MGRARKYITYNKFRLYLFTHSYAYYSIAEYIKLKYKVDEKLTTTKLRRTYFNKRAIPEIAKLSRVMSLDYKCLWQTIILGKTQPLGKHVLDRYEVKIYL